jgi:hypothetical protein
MESFTSTRHSLSGRLLQAYRQYNRQLPSDFNKHCRTLQAKKKAIILVFIKNYGLLRTSLDHVLVEAAGIEPASESPLQAVLHT